MSTIARHQRALLHLAFITSASDGQISDTEIGMIGRLVGRLPVFDGIDPASVVQIGEESAARLAAAEDLDEAVAEAVDGMPQEMRETALVIAWEVAAADGHVEPEEKRFLEVIREHLALDPLVAGALEYGVTVRRREAPDPDPIEPESAVQPA